jgi:hypothetical protein
MDKGLYVNRVAVTSSLYDFYFKLEMRKPKFDEKGNLAGEEVLDSVDMLMSPQHAESFYKALGAQIESYKKSWMVAPEEGTAS